ncbi:hypothetical protein SLEP1_g15160 [Rubroshorea leprosula]|uniref:Transposase (putative) gypsy type domain-containing protein n=1 Tax=Rubroshorea leprosula TaxID=152421 RepID=A0AAV5IVY8_9ROSI|nr:hypothetical protein SLEP1_g15160 [Rubroshorea leprosula]
MTCGLWLPLHPFIIQVCDEFCVGLPQLTPHLITVLIAFIVNCQLLNVPLNIEAFTFLFQLKPLEGTSAWYYIYKRHLEFEGFEGSRIKYDNSVLPTSLPTLGKTDWEKRFFFLEGPKNFNFPAVWRIGRINTLEILLNAKSYLIINKLLNNNSIKVEVLLDEGNLIRSKVWHHHHAFSTVIILNLPPDFEATKKPETSFQKSKKRKESSAKGSTIIALNLLDHRVKRNKNSTEEEDLVAMEIPKAQDCSKSSMRQTEQSSNILLVFPKTTTCTIESRYDPNMRGRTVLRESSFAYQLSKNFLIEEDKKHLKEFIEKTRWHETNHCLAKVMAYHQTLKEDYLKNEDASFYVKEETTKLKNLFSDVVQICLRLDEEKNAAVQRSELISVELENFKKLFANSHENYLSIKREKDEIEKVMKANHSALEETRKIAQLLQDEKEGYLHKLVELEQLVTKLSSQNASLQMQITNTSTDTIHKFKRLEEGQTWALSGCIDHFHLVVSIMKTLILERDLLKGDHIPSIQEFNIFEEIKQDPGLKKMFEDRVKKISKECYSENEGKESKDQECDSSNLEYEYSSQDEAFSS